MQSVDQIHPLKYILEISFPLARNCDSMGSPPEPAYLRSYGYEAWHIRIKARRAGQNHEPDRHNRYHSYGAIS